MQVVDGEDTTDTVMLTSVNKYSGRQGDSEGRTHQEQVRLSCEAQFKTEVKPSEVDRKVFPIS